MRGRDESEPDTTGAWLSGATVRGADYDRRFEHLASRGHDVHGEANFVASLGVARVFDAGCGTGRVAIELARRGLETVGVDLDPAMLDEARAKAPELEWHLGDLSSVRLTHRVDAVVLAGNVVLFLEPDSHARVIANLTSHLEGPGLLIAGFSLGHTVSLADYDAWASDASLELVDRFATWDRAPFELRADYAVSIHRLALSRPLGAVSH